MKMSIERIATAMAVVLAAVFCPVISAHASRYDWNGSGDGYWTTSANWTKMDDTSNDRFFRSLANTEAKRTVKFKTAASLGYTVSVENTGTATSDSAPYLFIADSDAYGFTTTASLNVGWWKAGHLAVRRGTFQSATVNVGNVDNTGSYPLAIGGTDNKATVKTTGNISIRMGTVKVLSNGTLSSGNILTIGRQSGKSAGLLIDGGLVKNTGNYIAIGQEGNAAVTIQNGGAYENVEGNGNAVIPNGAGTGTLRIDNGVFKIKGTLLLNYNANSVSSSVSVENGGVLWIKNTYLRYAGSGGSLTFDGGVLKAYDDSDEFVKAHDSLRVYAGSNGATIDSNGKSVTIEETIEDKSGESGKVLFSGGGNVTITAPVGWTGGTTIAAGTVLKFPVSVTNSVFSQPGGIVVSNPENISLDNVQILECTDGAFTEDELAFISIEGDTQGRYAIALADGGSKVVISDPFSGEYEWNGGSSGSSWTAPGQWSKNGVAGDWHDLTAAVFANAGDSATIPEGVTVTPASQEFRASASIGGEGTLVLSDPSIAVPSGETVSIGAHTSGGLVKSGAGSLVLGASRTEQTTLAEGTLSMANGATVDGTKLTLGADPLKPVVFDAGGGVVNGNLEDIFTDGSDVTLTNGTFAVDGLTANIGTGTLRFADGTTLSGTSALIVAGGDGSTRVCKDDGEWSISNFKLGSQTDADVVFYNNGGTLLLTGWSDFGTGSSSVRAHLEIAGGMVTNTAQYIHMAASSPASMTVKAGAKYGMSENSLGFIVSGRASGTLNVEGGDVFVNGPLNLCYRGGDAAVNVTDGGVLTARSVKLNSNSAGGVAAVTLDNGVMRAYEDNSAFIPNAANLTVTVGSNGATLDNAGFAITVLNDIAGTGVLTLSGAGATTLGAGVSVAPRVSVAAEATLAAGGANTISGGLEFGAGCTLAVPAPSTAAAAITAPSFTFAGGVKIAVPATLAQGRYKLFTLSEGTFAEGAADGLSVDGFAMPHSLVADGDTIYLVLERGYAQIDNLCTSLTIPSGTTELYGAGGVKVSALSVPAGATLVLDPVSTPISVSGTPVFASSAKIALSQEYSNITLGRIVLMTYTGTASIPAGLFDTSSVANSAGCVLSQETAPDGTSKQLVLTVGDYEHDAKTIRILAIGDSITHGYRKYLPGNILQQAQYRTLVAARLAANGYRPVMLGHLNIDASNNAATCDAAGVRQPDEWIWHSGVSGDKIMTDVNGGMRGGVRDNLHVYLDVAGEPDVVILLIGTNDLGSKTPEVVFDAYTNLVQDIKRQRPRTKIVSSTILERGDSAAVNEKVGAFNASLLANLTEMPDTFAFTNLYAVAPQAVQDNYFDGVHPTMKGFDPIAKGFAGKIMDALPFAEYGGPLDDMLTAELQVAQGAAVNVPQAYRNGMVHVFTIDAANSNNNFAAAVPYTERVSAVPLTKRVKKAGYYMELVRKGTSRRRFVWVDFDATGKTLDEIDFPWTGNNIDLVVEKLHVFSNDGSIHNVAADDDTVTGAIEGTHFNVRVAEDNASVPSDISSGLYGWNDTLDTSGTYGCFQAHRIFKDGEHWHGGEVLFAWNDWGVTSARNDEIGIGTFFLSSAFNGGSTGSADYTFTSQSTKGAIETLTSGAYQVRHLEIWVEVDPDAPAGVHGKWIGGLGDDRFSFAGNWDDGEVPVAGTTLDFRGISPNDTVVTADVGDVVYGTILIPEVNYMNLSGFLHVKAITNALHLAVKPGATLKVDGDAVLYSKSAASSHLYMFRKNEGTIDIGGKFINDSTSSAGRSLLYYSPGSTGTVKAGGFVNKDPNAVFSLCGNHATPIKLAVGAEGFTSAVKGFSQYSESNGELTIQAVEDFAIASQIEALAPLKFLTTGENGERLTITANHRIENHNLLTIAGTGTFVANTALNTTWTHSGSVSVTDTATLAVNPGKALTQGAITVGSSATLAVPMTGSVTIPSAVTLNGGAVLSFNFTSSDEAPKFVFAKGATASDTVKVKASAEEGIQPRKVEGKWLIAEGVSGTFELDEETKPTWADGVSVEGGNLYLDVKAPGLTLSVR